MTENQKSALAWARRNEKRIETLAAQARETWRAPYQRAALSDAIDALAYEARAMRRYAAQ
jgi:hypothetical protein